MINGSIEPSEWQKEFLSVQDELLEFEKQQYNIKSGDGVIKDFKERSQAFNQVVNYLKKDNFYQLSEQWEKDLQYINKNENIINKVCSDTIEELKIIVNKKKDLFQELDKKSKVFEEKLNLAETFSDKLIEI